MKRVILQIVVCFLITQMAVAQNTIAKLKFEEAEEAYANQNFELALAKIKETEALFKTGSPRILYLKIMTQVKIIENDPLKDYALIENTHASIKKYLRDYDNLPDNEEKYKDIYKISERLKAANIPASRQEFNDLVSKKRKEEQDRVDAANLKLKKNQDYILAVAARYYFKPNMTLSELGGLHEEYKKIGTFKTSSYINTKGVKTFSRGNPMACGGEVLTNEKNIVIGLTIRPCVKKHRNQDVELNEFVQEIKQNIDKEYIKEEVVKDWTHGNITNITVTVPGTNFQIETSLNGSSFQLYIELVR